MSFAFKEHNGTVLSGSLQTLLTFGSGLVTGGAVLQAVSLINTGASNRVVSVYLIPSGQAAANQYLIGKLTIGAGETLPLPGGPWYGASAAFVQALQDAGTDVIARCTAFDEA
jgi:hypothetical protein